MKKRSIAGRLGIAALALTLITTSLSSGTLAKYTSTFTGEGQLTVAVWNVGASFLDGNGNFKQTFTSSEKLDLGTAAKITASSAYALKGNATKQDEVDKLIKGDRTNADKAVVAPGTCGYIGIRLETRAFDEDSNSYTDKTEVGVDFDISVGYEPKISSPNSEYDNNSVLKPLSKRAGLPDNIIFKLYPSKLGQPDTTATPDAVDISNLERDQTTPVGNTVHIDANATGNGYEIVYLYWEWPYETKNGEVVDTAKDEKDTDAGISAITGILIIDVTATQTLPKVAEGA